MQNLTAAAHNRDATICCVSGHTHCVHVADEQLTLVSLPPLATSGSEVHMPSANAAVSVCPTNSKSGELAFLSCMFQQPLQSEMQSVLCRSEAASSAA